MFNREFDRTAYVQRIQGKLRILRAAADVSQAEVAEALGLVRSTYVNYENGMKVIPWEKCLALLFYFQSISGSRELLRELHLLPEDV